jgi:hypothetical protein
MSLGRVNNALLHPRPAGKYMVPLRQQDIYIEERYFHHTFSSAPSITERRGLIVCEGVCINGNSREVSRERTVAKIPDGG